MGHSMDNPNRPDFTVETAQSVDSGLQTYYKSVQCQSLKCPQRKKYRCPTLWTSQLPDWAGWWAGWWFIHSIRAVSEWTWQVPLVEVHQNYLFCLTLFQLSRTKECRRCMPVWGLVCSARSSTPLLALGSSKCFATSLRSTDPQIFYLDSLQALRLEVCSPRNCTLLLSTSTW